MSDLFPNPALLTHPNIPKPLHSVNPRSIKGDAWWDVTRRASYAKHDFCCWACGVHKLKAEFHNWLEGHEYYEIDYPNGIVTLKEVVALCHACHNFIHSGRLWMMYQRGQIPREKIERILDRGFQILDNGIDLKPFPATVAIWLMLKGESREDARELAWLVGSDDAIVMAPWEKWHLLLDGKKHFSPFKDFEAWKVHYSSGGEA